MKRKKETPAITITPAIISPAGFTGVYALATYRIKMFHIKSYADIERPASITNRSYCVVVSDKDLSSDIVFI